MDIKNEQNTNEENNIHKMFIRKVLKQFSNKVLLIFLILNIILVLTIIYIILIKQNNSVFGNGEESFVDNNIAIVNTTNIIQEDTKIKIHITGEVKNSGLYELEEESRISDAIQKAGGITAEADLTKVNLAYPLSDGQKIIIPSIKQENNGNYITEDSGENIIEETNTQNTKININTATISELTTLPGIGESTAEKIKNYREENGKFKNIEDLKNVSGIGESKYNQLKDYIKVK